MRDAMQAAARHVYATAVLLADNGAKPQIAVFSDDFFTGHEEIKMLEDTVSQGVKMIDGSSGKVDEGVSSELMRAALDIE